MSPTHDPTEALAADPSDCPICGEWRDSPEADCANCGWHIRPCGDALGLCVYAGPHEGPHKIAVSWRTRLDRLSYAGWHLKRAGDETQTAARRLVDASDALARWDEAHGYIINSERDALAGDVSQAWASLRAALDSDR